ncbi:MAG: YchJ family protein [Gammaproteobacteria bacterium]|nr:YchJ family protein [Gammaproteobacteria bacterium]
MTQCACGSEQSYDDCCGQYIDGNAQPSTAECQMRARYTAHTVGNMAYILRTHHPATRTDIDEAATAKWARESDWLSLDIQDIEDGQAEDDSARIEFMANYRDTAGRRHTHHEVALFEKHHGQWYFRDAELPDIQQFKRQAPKQGRNEPCACGSGKKFKKCCGSAV